MLLKFWAYLAKPHPRFYQFAAKISMLIPWYIITISKFYLILLLFLKKIIDLFICTYLSIPLLIYLLIYCFIYLLSFYIIFIYPTNYLYFFLYISTFVLMYLSKDGELEVPAKNLSSSGSKKNKDKRLIIILEGANLETCKVYV